MDVLISGASMAGLSAAYWFARMGHHVTVVERADGLRRGGAPIDVRGDALGVAERMGILDQISAQRVALVGPAPILDGTGEQVATLDLSWFANETDDDIEISRDRLNDIILAAIDPAVEFRFANSIDALTDDGGGVDVVLRDGSTARCDLVIGADGLHSNVRGLAFGSESDYVHHIGFYVALLNLDPRRTWDRALLNVPGMAVAIRDTGDGPRAMVIVHSPEITYDFRDFGAQRVLVGDFLDRVGGWQVPAIRHQFLDAATEGFYFDSVSQVRMPSWTAGRVALLGDAAHCAALLSGMGTSLAMIGAELLATTWTEADGNLDAASEPFHRRLRPHVDKAQDSVEYGSSIVVPGTQHDLDQRNQMFRDEGARRAAI